MSNILECGGLVVFSSSLGSERTIYAHEIVHALDRDPIRKAGGIGNLISDSTAWRAAWVAEIDCDDIPLTDYARESRREGFAEFGALALTNPVLARRAFPKCWAVWREHCLDSDEMPAPDRPAVATQPLSTSDATLSIAAGAADGATAA